MYARESLAWIPSHELDSNQHLLYSANYLIIQVVTLVTRFVMY